MCSFNCGFVLFYFYNKFKREKDLVVNNKDEERQPLANSQKHLYSVLSLFIVGGFTYFYVQTQPINIESVGRKLLNIIDDEEPHEAFPPEGTINIIGYLIGVISSLLYLCARIPQIVKNIRRGTTDGLSPFLFLMAFFGNLTQALSIFVRSRNPKFFYKSMPWIVGSAGVITMDFVILMQFLYYRYVKRKKFETELEVTDSTI